MYAWMEFLLEVMLFLALSFVGVMILIEVTYQFLEIREVDTEVDEEWAEDESRY